MYIHSELLAFCKRFLCILYSFVLPVVFDHSHTHFDTPDLIVGNIKLVFIYFELTVCKKLQYNNIKK